MAVEARESASRAAAAVARGCGADAQSASASGGREYRLRLWPGERREAVGSESEPPIGPHRETGLTRVDSGLLPNHYSPRTPRRAARRPTRARRGALRTGCRGAKSSGLAGRAFRLARDASVRCASIGAALRASRLTGGRPRGTASGRVTAAAVVVRRRRSGRGPGGTARCVVLPGRRRARTLSSGSTPSPQAQLRDAVEERVGRSVRGRFLAVDPPPRLEVLLLALSERLLRPGPAVRACRAIRRILRSAPASRRRVRPLQDFQDRRSVRCRGVEGSRRRRPSRTGRARGQDRVRRLARIAA